LELRTNLLRTDSLWPTCQGCTDALGANVARAEGRTDLPSLHLLRATLKRCTDILSAELRANLLSRHALRATG
jgi:hypothetical protein